MGRLHVGVANQVVARRHGQGRVALELVRSLLERGHEVTVYARRVDADVASEVRHRRIPEVRGLPGLLDELVVVPSVTWLMHRDRAELDVGVTIGACGAPPRPAVFDAQFAQPGWIRSWGPSTRPSAYHRLHAYLSGAIERVLVRRADLVVASTPVVARDVLAGASTPTVVVPNGIDLDEHPVLDGDRRAAERRRHSLPPDAFVIAFVGEYATSRKGLGWLLDAVAMGPGDEHVFVAGTGRDDVIRERIDRLGLAGRVHLAGFAPPVEAYAVADVLAVPSSYEPFSLVAVEAAACGTPVLASAAVGAAPLLGDGAVTVADPADPAQLRAQLDALRSDPSRLPAMAAAARRAAEDLAWGDVTTAAVDAIESVAAARGRHPGGR